MRTKGCSGLQWGGFRGEGPARVGIPGGPPRQGRGGSERTSGRIPDERVDELADLLEVTTALIAALGITEAEVKQAADRKRATRGGIERRIWLEHVELGGASDA
ncbi:hypothetical protein [Rhodococcus koreensis]|uniref:hypothetical protein n=1 Tax=Rhodococcus koreensis TaxID=99653 RepID=UPI00366AC2F4